MLNYIRNVATLSTIHIALNRCVVVGVAALLLSAQTPPTVTLADQLVLTKAKLSAAEAGAAVDRGRADYMAADAARSRAVAAAQQVLNGMYKKYGCTDAQVTGNLCHFQESAPDATGATALTLAVSPPPPALKPLPIPPPGTNTPHRLGSHPPGIPTKKE